MHHASCCMHPFIIKSSNISISIYVNAVRAKHFVDPLLTRHAFKACHLWMICYPIVLCYMVSKIAWYCSPVKSVCYYLTIFILTSEIDSLKENAFQVNWLVSMVYHRSNHENTFSSHFDEDTSWHDHFISLSEHLEVFNIVHPTFSMIKPSPSFLIRHHMKLNLH